MTRRQLCREAFDKHRKPLSIMQSAEEILLISYALGLDTSILGYENGDYSLCVSILVNFKAYLGSGLTVEYFNQMDNFITKTIEKIVL